MREMELATILLLSLSSNLDNVGIGISYGIRRINIPFASNLLIALVTSCGTLLSMLLGRTVYLFLSPRAACVAGGSVIISAGLWVILQQGLSKKDTPPHEARVPTPDGASSSFFTPHQIARILDNPIVADRDFSGHIDLREAAALALGLTVNNVPNGVAAGMLGLSAAIMTPAVFLASVVTIWIGIAGGHQGSRRLGNSAAWISGLLLIAIGAFEIAFH